MRRVFEDDQPPDGAILARIADLLYEQALVPLEKVCGELTLQSRIYGDDAIEFLENFSHEFGVDMKSFEMKKHFETEGWLCDFILSGFKNKKYVDISVADLIRIAKSKRWDM